MNTDKEKEAWINKIYREEYLPYCDLHLKGVSTSETWSLYLSARKRSQDEYEKINLEMDHLKDVSYELEQNLLCAEDQNHYFKLMNDYKDKFYNSEKTIEKYHTMFREMVAKERELRELLKECSLKLESLPFDSRYEIQEKIRNINTLSFPLDQSSENASSNYSTVSKVEVKQGPHEFNFLDNEEFEEKLKGTCLEKKDQDEFHLEECQFCNQKVDNRTLHPKTVPHTYGMKLLACEECRSLDKKEG